MRGPEETLRLFDDESGCLTDHALQSLLNGSLEELERLEVAEHLSYCDSCVERYTALLVPQVLEEPPELMKQSILSALRKRAAKLFVDRYFHMAVAASLTLVLWGAGCSTPSGSPSRCAGRTPAPRSTSPGPASASGWGTLRPASPAASTTSWTKSLP